MFYLRSKGQSTLEYVVLLGFVVAALIAMGLYMKRGFQGKLRESTDQIGEQYSAGQSTGKYTTKISLNQHESLLEGGQTTTNIIKDERNRTGNETVADFNSGY